MAAPTLQQLQKLAIEVTDHFRKDYPECVPVIVSEGDKSWAGMLYQASRVNRLYLVGAVDPTKNLFHLPDSPYEHYLSATTREAITPDRKAYHPWGPSFQLFPLSHPRTPEEQHTYEAEYSDKRRRIVLEMQRYVAKFGRWETVKPRDLKRPWPFEPKPEPDGLSWVELTHPNYPDKVYVRARPEDAIAVVCKFTPDLTEWTVSSTYVSWPPMRKGAQIHPAELFSWLDRSVWPQLTDRWNTPGTLGLALYINLELSSTRGPDPHVYPFGPAWTMKSEDVIVPRVGEMPSSFRYLEAWCLKP